MDLNKILQQKSPQEHTNSMGDI